MSSVVLQSSTDAVRFVIRSFSEARNDVRASTGLPSAEGVVSAVVSGRLPREGALNTGREYFVHGIGYSVALESEALVHIDTGDDGHDVFTVYDIRSYLSTAEDGALPVLSLEQLEQVVAVMLEEGEIIELKNGQLSLPEWTGIDRPKIDTVA